MKLNGRRLENLIVTYGDLGLNLLTIGNVCNIATETHSVGRRQEYLMHSRWKCPLFTTESWWRKTAAKERKLLFYTLILRREQESSRSISTKRHYTWPCIFSSGETFDYRLWREGRKTFRWPSYRTEHPLSTHVLFILILSQVKTYTTLIS